MSSRSVVSVRALEPMARSILIAAGAPADQAARYAHAFARDVLTIHVHVDADDFDPVMIRAWLTARERHQEFV